MGEREQRSFSLAFAAIRALLLPVCFLDVGATAEQEARRASPY